MTLVLLFIRYPYKNGLCALFVLCSVCFIPTFALPESQIANLDFSKLEKHTTKNRAIQASPEVRDVTDSQTFRGFFATVGTVKEVEGRVHWIQGECGLDDDRGFARLPHDWIGILYYGKDKSDASNTSSECPQVLDRVKNALMFGASAIIILTLHPQIVRELDIAQLFAQPVVVVDEAKNVTAVLSIINKAKLKVKLMFGSVQRHILHVPKLTMWSACGRSAGKGDEVVCFDQGYTGKKGKVDPSTFWSCYYLIVFLLMLSFVMKARMRNGEWGPADQELEASLRQLAFQALDMMQTHKYRKLMDRGQDTCAICLDQFYPKQKLRVLPCQHHFHTRCVDPWLVDNRTCPLCKLNIIEQLDEDD